MFVLLTALLLTVLVGGAVVAYVAYPHSERDIPRAGWLSRGLRGAVNRAGLDPDVDDAAGGGSLGHLHEQWSRHRNANRAGSGDPGGGKSGAKRP